VSGRSKRHKVPSRAKSDMCGFRIDGLNVSSIGLLDLRRRLAIIPQDAALFQGSVRDNLDPRHVHDDTELWSVLGRWCCSKVVSVSLSKWLIRSLL
jgi:ABC-type multidrug transport system fused ATPase/permease subunit